MLNNFGVGFLFSAHDLATGVMRKVKGELSSTAKEAGAAAGMIKGAFAAVGAGLGLMAAGSLGLHAISQMTAESKEYSKAIALVATEANLAVFPQEQMHAEGLKLAALYGREPVDQAKALYKAVALGADDAAKSTAFLNGVNLLAIAGNADLAISTDAIGGALNAYSANFDQATAYGDAFFVAMRRGNTTVQDLAQYIGHVTSSASNLNVSLDEVLSAVSTMTNRGINARIAISGLKEALANIIHPSKEARTEAARLGIHFNQAEIRAKGLQGFLKEITSSSRFNVESFSKLFNSVEGYNAIMQITNGNMSMFNATMEAMKDKSGETKRGFDIMSQTLSFQEDRYKALRKVIADNIGPVFERASAGVVRFVNSIMEGFLRLPKSTQETIAKFVLFASTTLVVVGAFLAAKGAIVLLIAGAKMLGVSLVGIAISLAPVILAVGALALAFYGLKSAYDQNVGGFADRIGGMIDKVRLAFDGLAQLFGDHHGFTGQIRESLNTAENAGVRRFVVNVFVLLKRVEHFFDQLQAGFNQAIKIMTPSIDAFANAIERLTGPLTTANNAAGNADKWKRWGDAGLRAGVMLANGFNYVLSVMTGVLEMYNALSDAGAITAFVWVGRAVVEIFKFLIGVVVAAFGILKEVLFGVGNIVTGVVMFIGGLFSGQWKEQWDGAALVVFGVVQTIIGIVGELVGAIAAAVDAIAGMFGKDLHLQESVRGFKDKLIGDWAKKVGLGGKYGGGVDVSGFAFGGNRGPGADNVTGDQIVNAQVPVAPLLSRTVSPDFAGPLPRGVGYSRPIGGFSGPPPQMQDQIAAVGYLRQIAAATARGNVIHVYIDSEKIPFKTEYASREPRNFTPAPPPR